MEEKSKLDAVEAFAEECRKDHKVVVVHPDEVVVGVDNFEDLVGEDLVGGDVGLPQGAVEAAAKVRGEGQHVVEEGPQLLLAETMVVSGKEFRR